MFKLNVYIHSNSFMNNCFEISWGGLTNKDLDGCTQEVANAVLKSVKLLFGNTCTERSRCWNLPD